MVEHLLGFLGTVPPLQDCGEDEGARACRLPNEGSGPSLLGARGIVIIVVTMTCVPGLPLASSVRAARWMAARPPFRKLTAQQPSKSSTIAAI